MKGCEKIFVGVMDPRHITSTLLTQSTIVIRSYTITTFHYQIKPSSHHMRTTLPTIIHALPFFIPTIIITTTIITTTIIITAYCTTFLNLELVCRLIFLLFTMPGLSRLMIFSRMTPSTISAKRSFTQMSARGRMMSKNRMMVQARYVSMMVTMVMVVKMIMMVVRMVAVNMIVIDR